MELRVNDLLRIDSAEVLMGNFENASWVNNSIERAPLVVVRRAPIVNNVVPVGIRGCTRSQRAAAEVAAKDIIEVITPEQIARKKLWRNNDHIKKTKMFKALEDVHDVFKKYNISWGPTGSTGFELASGVETIKSSSDLDIIACSPDFMSIDTARNIIKELSLIPIKMDVQIETSNGCVALEEYVRDNKSIMLRTVNGPRLVKNPWSDNL